MAGVAEGGEVVKVVRTTLTEGNEMVHLEIGGGGTVGAAITIPFEYAGAELLFVSPGWTAAGQWVSAEGLDVLAQVGDLTYECALVGSYGPGAEVGFDAGEQVGEFGDVDGALLGPGGRHGGHEVSLPPFHRGGRRRGR